MKYIEPTSIAEVVRHLAADAEARCLAGGQTLIAMLNADLVAPSMLIGLRKVAGLDGVQDTGSAFRIGAMTTHAAIAADRRLVGAAAVVRSAAGQIAHPAIRHCGTIGGAVAHADPAADFPAALCAAGASVEIQGPQGTRTVAATEFFVGYLETVLQPGEMVTALVVPKGPPGCNGHYLKFSRVEGDYATVSVAVVLAMSGGRCGYARVALGSVAPTPVRVEAADAALLGTALEAAAVTEAGRLLNEAADPVDDVRGSSAYRRLLIPRLLGRALEQCQGVSHG